MIPLYFMGFGSLKGFALTTIVGVAIGIFITRPAYGKIISEILNK
jgi:preprotein translocase subunit SecD